MTIGEVIAAIFLPPLAIFLEEGLSRNFWIGALLTCFAFVPGIIFAFFNLSRDHGAVASPA